MKVFEVVNFNDNSSPTTNKMMKSIFFIILFCAVGYGIFSIITYTFDINFVNNAESVTFGVIFGMLIGMYLGMCIQKGKEVKK